MKNNRGVFVLIAVVVLIIIAFFFFTGKKAEAPIVDTATSTASSIEGVRFESKLIQEGGVSQGYIIKITYPVLMGLENDVVQRNINKQIFDKVTEISTDFKSSTRGGVTGDEPSTLDIDFIEEKNTTLPNVIGFKMSESYFEAGAAHPGQTVETFNFDTTTGTLLSVEDIFIPTSEYLKKISTYSIAELQKKLGYSDQIKMGAGPEAENFVAFLITDTGLKVIFNQYQVAAYAAGIQEVTIPYKELKSYISKTGVLQSVFDK